MGNVERGTVKLNFGTGRMKCFKSSFSKLTEEDVSWSSTGGDCKMLKLNDVELRAYTSSK